MSTVAKSNPVLISSLDTDSVSDTLRLIRSFIVRTNIALIKRPFDEVNYDTDVFYMSYGCGCEKEDCPKCDVGNLDMSIDLNVKIKNIADNLFETSYPNFVHKPSGFCVWWYKHLGRGMLTSCDVVDLFPILSDCLNDITKLYSV